MADLNVGIIGGGIAGICSAVALKESGFDFALYSDDKQYPQNSPPYASLNPKYGIASYNHNLLHFHAIGYAKEFYTKILTYEKSNESIKFEAQKRLSRDLSE